MENNEGYALACCPECTHALEQVRGQVCAECGTTKGHCPAMIRIYERKRAIAKLHALLKKNKYTPIDRDVIMDCIKELEKSEKM